MTTIAPEATERLTTGQTVHIAYVDGAHTAHLSLTAAADHIAIAQLSGHRRTMLFAYPVPASCSTLAAVAADAADHGPSWPPF